MPKLPRSRYVEFGGVAYSVFLHRETGVVRIETGLTVGAPVPPVVVGTALWRDGCLVERRGDLPAGVFELAEKAVPALGGRVPPRPHRLNVLGDFYVESGCCTRCGVPWWLAPELFSDHDDGCYVKKQPEGGAELEKMLDVIHTQELYCVRYRGRDPGILRTLKDRGEADKCDVLDPTEGAD
jgi:hypothetical protein